MALAILKGASSGTGDVAVNCSPFVVGRSITANLIIPHINVSRSHCEISFEESVWVIRDKSSSGTYINGCLIGKENERAVDTGDQVRFGSSEFNFSWTFYPLNKVVDYDDYDEDVYSDERGKTVSVKDKIHHQEMAGKTLNQFVEMSCSVPVNSHTPPQRLLQFPNDITQNTTDKCDLPFMLKQQERCFFMKKKCSLKKSESNESFSKTKRKIDELDHSERLDEEERSKLNLLSPSSSASNIITNFKPSASFDKMSLSENDRNNFPAGEIESRLLSYQGGCREELMKELEQMKSILKNLECKNSTLLNELAKAKNQQEAEGGNMKSEIIQNFTELMENELQCTICSEFFVDAVTLGCSHSFCQLCLHQWKKKQTTCPICREKITLETRSLVLDNCIEKLVDQLSPEVRERRRAVIEERKQMACLVKKTKHHKKKYSKGR